MVKKLNDKAFIKRAKNIDDILTCDDISGIAKNLVSIRDHIDSILVIVLDKEDECLLLGNYLDHETGLTLLERAKLKIYDERFKAEG